MDPLTEGPEQFIHLAQMQGGSTRLQPWVDDATMSFRVSNAGKLLCFELYNIAYALT